jgi:predicted transcriptional regulator
MTPNDVYRKIVEISERTINPRTPIMINNLTYELNANNDALEPYINHLMDLGLIKFHEVSRQSVRLTFLGKNAQR